MMNKISNDESSPPPSSSPVDQIVSSPSSPSSPTTAVGAAGELKQPQPLLRPRTSTASTASITAAPSSGSAGGGVDGGSADGAATDNNDDVAPPLSLSVPAASSSSSKAATAVSPPTSPPASPTSTQASTPPPPSSSRTLDNNNHCLKKDNQKSSSSLGGGCGCFSTIRRRWVTLMDYTRDWITLGVVTLAKSAARNPKSCIAIVTFISVLLIGVGLLTNFDMNVSSWEQMTPVNSVQRTQKQWIVNESGFPVQPYSMRIMIHADGHNVLSRQGIWHVYEVLDKVTTSIPRYEEYCTEAELLAEETGGGYYSLCGIRAVTLLWNNSLTIAQEELLSETDVILAVNADKYPNGGDVDVREIMGQMTVHYDTVVEAQSFIMEVLVPGTVGDGSEGKQIATQALHSVLDLRQQWLDQPQGLMKERNVTTNLVTETPTYRIEVMLTDHSIEEEMLRAAFKDIPLVPAVFVIMAIFTCIVFSTTRKQDQDDENHACEQRILLGVGAVFTVLLSLVSAYGLLWACGTYIVSSSEVTTGCYDCYPSCLCCL